jgi:hypothetical protein
MESWFSTVTSEEGERFESYAHAKEALFDYIEVFYTSVVDTPRSARSAQRSSNDDRLTQRSQTVHRIGSSPSVRTATPAPVQLERANTDARRSGRCDDDAR